MTVEYSDESDLILEELFAPRVRAIIDEGRVYRDPDYSLYHVAREAVGWCNWLDERGIAYAGDPIHPVYRAANALGFDEEQVERTWASTKREAHVPSAKYKGDDTDGKGDIACWQHIAGLDHALFQQKCPLELQPQVIEAIQEYREQHPNQRSHAATSAFTPRAKPQKGVASSTTQPQSPIPAAASTPKKPKALPTTPPRLDAPQSSSAPSTASQAPSETVERDRRFGDLARTIVGEAGVPTPTGQEFTGQSRYRITLEIETNTLKVYARDRGESPIFLNEEGKIDHAKSRVTPADVEAFETELLFIQTDRQRQHMASSTQIEV